MESFDGLTLDEFLKAREYSIRARLLKPETEPLPKSEASEPAADPLSDEY